MAVTCWCSPSVWTLCKIPVKLFVCMITREDILTWLTGCFTVCVKPGSPPPSITWPTWRSSSRSSSICLSSCSTPTTSTWVSMRKRGWKQLKKSWVKLTEVTESTSIKVHSAFCSVQVPSRMAPSWVTWSCHLGPRETPESSSESTERSKIKPHVTFSVWVSVSSKWHCPSCCPYPAAGFGVRLRISPPPWMDRPDFRLQAAGSTSCGGGQRVPPPVLWRPGGHLQHQWPTQRDGNHWLHQQLWTNPQTGQILGSIWIHWAIAAVLMLLSVFLLLSTTTLLLPLVLFC